MHCLLIVALVAIKLQGPAQAACASWGVHLNLHLQHHMLLERVHLHHSHQALHLADALQHHQVSGTSYAWVIGCPLTR